MRIKVRNPKVFQVDSKTCRIEFETDAEQRKPLLQIFSNGWSSFAMELSKWTRKRSQDANAYAWVLMTKIADALTASKATITKDDVYLDMLKAYGQGGVVKIKDADAEKWKRAWKYTEPHEKLTQEKAQYWRFWVGSSEYDSAEMSAFITGIIEEAKELGIETLAPDELERMMGQWGRTDKPKPQA